MVKDIDCGWSGPMPYQLLAVKESWKHIAVDLYIMRCIVMLRMNPEMKRVHFIMYGNYKVMVMA